MISTIDDPTASSVEFLRAHTDGCHFARADINGVAKRLSAGEAIAMPSPDDSAALKVEKNALAILFIPAVLERAEALLDAQPGMLFYSEAGQLRSIDARAARRSVDPGETHGGLCQLIYRSMSNVFLHAVEDCVAAARSGTLSSVGRSVTPAILARYEKVLADYHGHTTVGIAFTPTVHIMAGIHTALFFILRVVSAIDVLGSQRLGRKLGAAEISAAVKLSTPLLAGIARCHLEQLMELEVLLGKEADLFMTEYDDETYQLAIANMFALPPGEAIRVELSRDLLADMPQNLASEKPRTSCPALFAATGGGENAITSLVRLVDRAYGAMV